jgi:acyl-[acyl-carrier-protein] desaturase
MYRAYMEFFEIAERHRRWSVFDDIPWERLGRERISENTAVCLETFCGVELYVPDYTANGLILLRSMFGHAWFQANWGYEESKHALVFREYLIRSGLRSEEQYSDYEEQIFSKVWNLPFATRREMVCYGALQEMATYLIYAAQRDKHEREGNQVLQNVFRLVARDEAAHLGFYRKVLRFELEDNREDTLEDLAHVVAHFRMPGADLIPDYNQRLQEEGVGLTPQEFLRLGIFPTLKSVGTTRVELMQALRRRNGRADAISADTSPAARSTPVLLPGAAGAVKR